MQLPKPLRNLNKSKALLLLGGAFGFVALVVWFGLSFRLVRDHLAQPPRQALAGFYLEGVWPKELVTALPDPAKAVLNSSFPNGPKDAVVYATLDNSGNVCWSARTALKGGWKLIPRRISGYGFVAYNDQRLPIELTLSQNWVAARVGRGFRGFNIEANRPPSRLIKAIPEGAYLYVLDTNAHQSGLSFLTGVIKQNLKISDSWSKLYSLLGGQVETIVSTHKDAEAVFQPFLAAAPASPWRQTSQVDAAISELLGELLPKLNPVELPDQTSSIELKSGRSQIVTGRKNNRFGVISRYSSPEKPKLLTSFEDTSNNFWISNTTEAIQVLLLASEDSSLKFSPACAPLTPAFQTVYYPDRAREANVPTQWITTLAGNLKKMVFSLNEKETGLFTICGYYL